MQLHAGMNVLRDGVGLKSADLFQRCPAEEPAAAGEEGTVMPITSHLQRSEEKGLFVLDLVSHTKIPLKDVRIVEMMGCLDDGYLGIRKEADGRFK